MKHRFCLFPVRIMLPILTILALIPKAHALQPICRDGMSFSLPGTFLQDGITYVPLRAFTTALQPDWTISWIKEGYAMVEDPNEDGVSLVFRPGETHFWCDGTKINLSGLIHAAEGRLFLPLRPLAAALGLEVSWSPASGAVLSAEQSETLFWLAKIISAESQGESLEGQIAVGNVVLNRVASPNFPNTIYDVIFEPGQFEPVRNGSIWNEPTQSCILAARLCLAGANTVGDSLYFLAPNLTSNHWTMYNREYVTTIGVHWFYR